MRPNIKKVMGFSDDIKEHNIFKEISNECPCRYEKFPHYGVYYCNALKIHSEIIGFTDIKCKKKNCPFMFWTLKYIEERIKELN